jgi:hypothetical protein
VQQRATDVEFDKREEQHISNGDYDDHANDAQRRPSAQRPLGLRALVPWLVPAIAGPGRNNTFVRSRFKRAPIALASGGAAKQIVGWATARRAHHASDNLFHGGHAPPSLAKLRRTVALPTLRHLICANLAKDQGGEAGMARKKSNKPAWRAAAKSRATKKSAAAKSPARKLTTKSTARRKLRSKGGAAPPVERARPKQRVAISHHRDEDFKADGLRAYAKYRDLGIADATRGLARAHVIRLIGPCNPQEVSKLHFHDVDFQMVYVLKGWVKTYMEGQGENLMKEGSSWTQPPRIRHLIMDYSDDVELLEVILPADFETVELTA